MPRSTQKGKRGEERGKGRKAGEGGKREEGKGAMGKWGKGNKKAAQIALQECESTASVSVFFFTSGVRKCAGVRATRIANN